MRTVLGILAALVVIAAMHAVFAGVVLALGSLCRACLEWQIGTIVIGVAGVVAAVWLAWRVIGRPPRRSGRGRA